MRCICCDSDPLTSANGLVEFSTDFSKDINTIDETISQFAEDFIFTHFIVIDTIVVISYTTHFSKDINTIDETISQFAEDFIFTHFIVINTTVVISYTTPWFTIVIFPLTIVYLLIQVRIMYSIIKLYFSCSEPLHSN